MASAWSVAVLVTLALSTLVNVAFAQTLRCGVGFNRSPCPVTSPERFGQRACPADFRDLDGTCTNNVKKIGGVATMAHYSYFSPTSSRNPTGTSRKSPRLISNVLSAQTSSKLNRRGITEFFTFFGQFIDHCIVLTGTTSTDMAIEVPRDDPLYSNTTRLRFSRSARVTARRGSNDELPANFLPSALDLAAVYGPSDDRLNKIRVGADSCYLKTGPKDTLPLNLINEHNDPNPSRDFFLAGDVRANENPMLTALHTIFVREHNRICGTLDRVTKRGKIQFKIARRINIAQFQKIVYEEFYPTITGRKLRRYRGFKKEVDAGVSVLFSTAAFRVGHTMIGGDMKRRGRGNSPMSSLSPREMFFRKASFFQSSGPEPFIRGAVGHKAQEVDTMVMDSLRQILFRNVQGLQDGIDLIALNVQRGRDHALPSYNAIRAKFGLSRVSRFSQVTRNRALQGRLQSMYKNPDDMDVWIALMAEDHASGASMGPTMLKIWEREFTRLRDSDSFFYEGRRHFTGQVVEVFPQLRKLRTERNLMRKIILRNSDITESELRQNIFKM